MRTKLPAFGFVPCTARAATRTTASDEHDDERFVRGVALGLLLSAVSWAWLAVALRTALG